MKAEELAVIKERAGKATIGDWDYDVDDKEISNGNFMVLQAEISSDGYAIVRAKDADMGFITNSREDVPNLVAEVERLQAKLSECESLLGNAYGLLDDVHCYETETYEAITDYFYGEDDE